MTEAPIEWHPEADFFRVVCRLGALLPDGLDADANPDLTTKSGKVTISSTAPGRILVKTETDGHDRILAYNEAVYDVIAATGQLVSVDGTVGCTLLDPSSDRVKPKGYAYTATIKIGTDGPTLSVTFDATPTHPDGTVDLARLVVEPIMDGMTPTTVAQQLAAMQAQIDGVGAVDPALIAAEVEDYLTANPVTADPAAHKASHATGGTDALTPADIGAATAAQGVKADSASQPGHTHTSGSVTDFTEAVQDAVAAMLVSGANVTLAYDDTLGKVTVTAAGGDAEVMRDTIGAALVGTGGVVVAVNDAADTITLSIAAGTYAPALGADDNYVTDAEKAKLSDLSGTNSGDQDLSGYLTIAAAPELVRDTIAAALVAGSGVTITPNDAGDTITIASTGGGGGGTTLRHPVVSVAILSGEPSVDNEYAVHLVPFGSVTMTVMGSGEDITVWPLSIPTQLNVTEVSALVRTAEAGRVETIRLHTSVNGLPGATVLSLTVNASTAGKVSQAVSVTIPAGDYWISSGNFGAARLAGWRPPGAWQIPSVGINSDNESTFIYDAAAGTKSIGMPENRDNLAVYTGRWIRDDASAQGAPVLGLKVARP